MSLLKGNQLQFDDKWPQMRETVLKLLRQDDVLHTEWQDLFWSIHSVCMWDEKGGTKIHQALQAIILDFIRDAQKRVLSHEDNSALLNAYIAEWTKFFTQCDYLPKPFFQLEVALQGKHSFPKKVNNDESIVRKLMLDSWNQSIFSNIKLRLQDSAMKLVLSERNGESFDAQLVIGVRESYVNLSSSDCEDKLKIYRDNFEQAYLETTESFYRTHAVAALQTNGVEAYMAWADAKLREEEHRARRYLESRKDCNSVDLLISHSVRVLVTNFKDDIIARCPDMIRNHSTEKLKLMFSLLDRIDHGIDQMLTHLEEHIRQQGLDDMNQYANVITNDSEKYVEKLLDLFDRFSGLVHLAFNDDPRFLTSRDKAFEEIVNDTSIFNLELQPRSRSGGGTGVGAESKCPELLANFCDQLLRRTPLSKRLTSDEIDRKLRDVLLVLKYVSNKDVFMRFHKNHLTRRLILETSADDEKEENLVTMLRDVGVPADYVNKLGQMFNDVKISADLNREFKELHRNNNETLADLISIKILKAGTWSKFSERIPVTLPTELEDFIPEVDAFYATKHCGRRLNWHHYISNGVINFENEMGKYELEVTTFQMAVLFAYNDRPESRLSFESLRLATELPDTELRRTLHMLVAFPKLKRQVLLCEPEVKNSKEFTEQTLFYVNQQFAIFKNGHLQRRGRQNLIGKLVLNIDASREEDNVAILQLRRLRIQEAIVKILKMRKRLNNASLQSELVVMLRDMFRPDKKLVKEQLEWLIEQKYLKRDDKDLHTFIYLA